jgi:nucleoside-diphosphate-sugar epimerase
MAMPDAIEALLALGRAPADRLSRTAYNVGAFAVTAEDVRRALVDAFAEAEIDYRVDERRQRIVDSWPAELDDCAARRDWGLAPRLDFARTLSDYVLPAIRAERD